MARSGAICRLALALALLCAACAASAQEDAAPQQKIFNSAVFPAGSDRPPLWKFRSLKDVKSITCEVNKVGALMLSIDHNTIKGVTPAMMQWHYENLEKGVSIHPINKKAYSNFLLFHPRDHVKHTASKHPLTSKDVETNWVEFHLTGCKSQADPKTPWVCDQPANAANPGVTRSTQRAVWQGMAQTNGTMNVGEFSSKGIEFKVKGCNERGQCATVVRTKHSWRPAEVKGDAKLVGLEVATRTQVGLNMGLAQGSINPRVLKNWMNGEDAIKKCWRTALHVVEEYGALEYWLPAAYTADQAKHGNTTAATA